MSKTTSRSAFNSRARGIIERLKALRDEIDALGEMGTDVAGTDRADMLACFASNTLYGTQALVEQIKFVVEHPRARRAVWP